MSQLILTTLQRMARRKSHLRGVTLVELMLVVGLVGILAAMATPSLQRLSLLAREKSALEQLDSHLRHARSMARSRLATVTVTLEPGAVRLSSALSEDQVLPLDGLLTELSPDTTDGKISFGASGGLTEAVPVNIHVMSRLGSRYRFVVYPAIGAIRRL